MFDKEVVDYLRAHYRDLLQRHGMVLKELEEYKGDETSPIYPLIKITKQWLTEEESATQKLQSPTTSQGAE